MLDWLGDIGGLRDALFNIGMLVMFINVVIRGNKLEAWLLESFYKKPSKIAKNKEDVEISILKIKDRTPFRLKSSFFYCLRTRKEKRILDKGLDHTLNELEVDKFIRTQKKVRVALKILFTKLERFLIRNH